MLHEVLLGEPNARERLIERNGRMEVQPVFLPA
jgi:hypothetical protein